MKELLRSFVHAFRRLHRRLMPQRVFLVQTEPEQVARGGGLPLTEKIDFYFQDSAAKIVKIAPGSLRPLFAHGPVLLYGPDRAALPRWHRLFNNGFDVNERRCATEAWSWFEARVHLEGVPDLAAARAHFDRWRASLDSGLKRVCLFGTGPSLARAIDRDWSGDLRIVCNTIVRDHALWHHLRPHAITAGDALYHFGYTDFARSFRRDLRARLKETPETVFIYPDQFHSRVALEIDIAPQRLIPVPTGRSVTVHDILVDRFELPALGNVLNKLLLPIGCAVARRIGLWGFDGRAPDDKLFWANSSKHSYPELMSTLQAAHPAFFDHFVPKADPEQYVRSVHGDVLEHCLASAEAAGFQVEMLHKSWTETLICRYPDG